MTNRTVVSFAGQAIHINGRPTYEGQTHRGHKVEGLLLNSRMVQATYHDENSETASLWSYPDGRPFDPDANTDAFVKMLPEWKAAGLLAVTLNLQGGSPRGYSKEQPWRNSAFTPTGELKPAYLARVAKVLDAADALQMAVVFGYFYFGQTKHLIDEAAIVRATDSATDWLLTRGDRHVLVEIANECDHRDYPPILRPPRAGELIRRVKERSGGRLLVSTSFLGRSVPTEDVVAVADYLLIHGNGQSSPDGLREQIRRTRQVDGYRDQPVICNEDDHFGFDKPDSNFLAAVGEYCSWGYFDYRMAGEGWNEGYQSVPTDWTTSSDRKRGFFKLLGEMTGRRNSNI